MSDFKDRMIEAVERGETTMENAAGYVTDQYLAAADEWRDRFKEAGGRNPLVVPMFCQTCHYNEGAHPRDECPTGFIPGDVEAAHDHNERIGFPTRPVRGEK